MPAIGANNGPLRYTGQRQVLHDTDGVGHEDRVNAGVGRRSRRVMPRFRSRIDRRNQIPPPMKSPRVHESGRRTRQREFRHVHHCRQCGNVHVGRTDTFWPAHPRPDSTSSPFVRVQLAARVCRMAAAAQAAVAVRAANPCRSAATRCCAAASKGTVPRAEESSPGLITGRSSRSRSPSLRTWRPSKLPRRSPSTTG